MKTTHVVLSACGVLFLSSLVSAETARWPREIQKPGGTIVIYQPQLESFKGNSLKARAAVSVKPAGSEELHFGAVWFDARVVTDRENRLVELDEPIVTDVKFPQATKEQRDKLRKAIDEAAKDWDLSMSLDHFLAAVELAEKQQAAAVNFSNDPPKLLLSKVPAVLVSIEGDPKLRKVENANLMRVANTPYLIVLDMDGKAYYLSAGENWMKAEQVTGPWKITDRVPSAALALAAGKDPAGLSGLSVVKEPAADEVVPVIYVATEPTELIVIDGEAEFQTIPATNLLYVSNTESDIFVDITTQNIYLLLSGRWFTAATKAGPWKYVPPGELPKDFSRILPGSPKADVLASVPDTEEAREAAANACVPQTAAVKRSEAKLTVTYDGEPKFEPIQGTSMAYAVNTAYSVIQVGGKFYCCNEAVWFESAYAAGPWAICTSVPKEIYTIPPTCPVYQTTYVYVYDSTPDVVYVGYTPGYEGCYVYGGCVVYGTGFWYRPWWGNHFYPRPTTWGFSAHYNPQTGNWWAVGWAKGSNGWVIHGGGGHVGPYPYHPVWNSHTMPGLSERGAGNLYANREGIQAAARNRGVTGNQGLAQAAQQAAARPNNLFTDRDGGVYKKSLDGWQRADGNAGDRLDNLRRQDLDNQFRARNLGDQRARQFSQPSSGSRSFSRPAAGGGFRRGRG